MSETQVLATSDLRLGSRASDYCLQDSSICCGYFAHSDRRSRWVAPTSLLLLYQIRVEYPLFKKAGRAGGAGEAGEAAGEKSQNLKGAYKSGFCITPFPEQQRGSDRRGWLDRQTNPANIG